MDSTKKVKNQNSSRSRDKPHYNMWENLDQKQIRKIKEHIISELDHDVKTQKKAALILEEWLKNNT